MRKIILWLMVLFFAFFFAGHIFELIANIPNWQSGEIADVARYRDFYAKSGPGDYFSLTHGGSLLFSLIGLAVVWKRGGQARIAAVIAVLIVLGVGVYTYLAFLPTNIYIANTEYDAVLLKSMVAKWVANEPFRFIAIGIGLAASIWCFEASRNKSE
ncbi:hypothetical protein BH10ACI1_BH10ACI1_32310 [soil metagenome]